jgi:hypothetical protein
VNLASKGFFGGSFDGRYVYLVPNNDGTGNNGFVTRYDTQATFTAAASWSTFDTTALGLNTQGFEGAVFDGRYLYLLPGFNGQVARYDTQATFGVLSSWASFDTTALGANAMHYAGAAFDGRYVYFVPTLITGAMVTRYDTQAGFTAAASWSTFDTTSLNPKAQGFIGAAFDGRYLYLVPNNFGAGGILARYDTQASFVAPGSWFTFDTTTVNTHSGWFAGAAFDGRYVYFVPTFNTSYISEVTRYDTQAPFAAVGSWSSFSQSSLNSNAVSFMGAVFDGRFVYLVPNLNGVVARFDAKSPTSMPKLPGFFGSFL